MNKRQRLAGIDLVRGLAVYGVVILHSDQSVQVLPNSWQVIRQFAAFAVPFFLATSFYLAAAKLHAGKPYPFLPRANRLLIPYVFWSAFYLSYRSLKYYVTQQPERIPQLFHDPISILFFGGAAFHLYFLPLLLVGTLLVKLVERFLQRSVSLNLISLMTLGSLLLYEFLILTGNAADNGTGLAFQPLYGIFSSGSQSQIVRVLLVGLAWMIRCLPFVSTALLLTHPAVAPRLTRLLSRTLSVWLLAFLVINFQPNLLPGSVHDLARGYSALLFALALSDYRLESAALKNLGFCCFGIYLIHLFFVEMVQSLWVRLDPGYVNQVSTLTLLLVSAVIFLVSWGMTALLTRNPQISKVLV